MQSVRFECSWYEGSGDVQVEVSTYDSDREPSWIRVDSWDWLPGSVVDLDEASFMASQFMENLIRSHGLQLVLPF